MGGEEEKGGGGGLCRAVKRWRRINDAPTGSYGVLAFIYHSRGQLRHRISSVPIGHTLYSIQLNDE